MSRTVKDAQLTTATARLRLPRGVHWRHLGEGSHLGYRKSRDKGQAGGLWAWRHYRGAGRYWQGELAPADDELAADGLAILSFRQAERRAREAIEQKLADQARENQGPPLTLAEAVIAYVDKREARGREGRKRDARSRLTRYILGDKGRGLPSDRIASIVLSALTREDLAEWRERLGDRQPALSPATIVRCASDLKAALNAAHQRHRARLPAEFPITVRDGLATPRDERKRAPTQSARADQILGVGDIRGLIRAAREIDAERGWEGDLARLIIVLAATGARFSQVATLTVGDVQAHARRIMVPVSEKGQGAKATTHTPVAVTQDVLDALAPATIGRPASAPLLERWRHVQVGPADWRKDRRGPWLSASEVARPWRAIVARASLPRALVPYCLRHSSIVRGLRANLPVRLVAAQHDTSASMIERHYSAFIVTALDELAASVAVPLAETAPGATIVPLVRPA